MSDDLIKRSDAIKDLCDISNNSDMPEDWHRGMSVAISALYRVPSADRPQGEWIEQEDCWQCSECGDEYVLEVGVKPIDARMHYCPNCGARMKGVDDE